MDAPDRDATVPGSRNFFGRRAIRVLAALGLALIGSGLIQAGLVTSSASPSRWPAPVVPAVQNRAATRPGPSGFLGPTGTARPDPRATSGGALPGGPNLRRGLPRSPPVRLVVPRIGINTAVVPLGLNPDGTVAVPALGRDSPAGWYRYLAAPGESGPAVILGHVDSARDGPAVFYRLGELNAGDLIEVIRADGSRVLFSATAISLVPKNAFPTAAVYGPVDHPALRLITCGGRFDRTRHSYRDNVIVFASPIDG